jgi:hypothetical protein
MAWRIDEAVIRGEIDNRVRGRVTGRIWFMGKDEPVELDLAGNAWRDLAGRRLEFTNLEPKTMDLERFPARQTGVIGDCTASRKVKVPDIPMDQIGEYYAAKKKWTWHWGNSLYLEWFSTTNGRVMIESATYQLVITPESAWEMTPEEDEQQRRTNAEAMGNFMDRLGKAVAQAQTDKSEEPSAEEKEQEEKEQAEEEQEKESNTFDQGKPFTEEEAEKMDAENELLLDRIRARMDREGADADFEKILEEERERRRVERGETPLTPEQQAERDEWIAEMNRAAAESAENLDPEEAERLDREHPLAERAGELSLRLLQEPEERGWLSVDAGEEHPLADLGAAVAEAGAKLAGALNGEDWPPPVEFAANTIVRLKRARSYIDDALMAAEVCTQQKLAEPAWLAEARRELNALAHECDTLIGELRARLTRGFD